MGVVWVWLVLWACGDCHGLLSQGPLQRPSLPSLARPLTLAKTPHGAPTLRGTSSPPSARPAALHAFFGGDRGDREDRDGSVKSVEPAGPTQAPNDAADTTPIQQATQGEDSGTSPGHMPAPDTSLVSAPNPAFNHSVDELDNAGGVRKFYGIGSPWPPPIDPNPAATTPNPLAIAPTALVRDLVEVRARIDRYV